MTNLEAGDLKPNLLCIVPPYSTNSPPAGAAALLGYLKANGCFDFDFLDLRLGVPDVYAPTYTHTGAFAEAYVMDIPDLPLVLELLSAFERGEAFLSGSDATLQRYCLERGISPHFLQSYLRCLDQYFGAIFEQIPRLDFVGFSVWTSNYLSTLLAAAHLKRRKAAPFIVAGGPQVTESRASAALGLRSGLFDAVALGEGEQTLCSLYEAFDRRHRSVPEGVPGALHIQSSTGQLTLTEQPLIRMPSLPLPSFSEMNLQAYQEDDTRSLPFQFSRGCTDKCSFCSEWVFWRHFRLNTADHVIGQILQLRELYDVSFITFTDSLLNGHLKRLRCFAETLLEESIGIEWSGFMRAQMDRETATLLKRAGCYDVFIGIESFSDETLKLMNKRRTELENLQAIRAFLEAGIGVTAGLIPGFPGDTRDAFMHSVLMIQELQKKYPGQLAINEEPFIVSPGQPLYSNLEENGLAPNAWDERYLAIAPNYEDITSDIWCTVAGESQGLERLGRLKVAATITTDTPVRASFFDYDETESVSANKFDFEHVFGGWYLARIKTQMAFVYALLVNQTERDILEELQEEAPLGELTDKRISPTLRTIERKHITCPSRTGPRVISCHYSKRGGKSSSYMVSPFVVSRPMDWRHAQQTLIVDYVTDRVRRKSAIEGTFLAYLAKAPRTEDQLWTFARRNQLVRNRQQLINIIHRLKEDGNLVICHDREKETVDVQPLRPEFERTKSGRNVTAQA